MNTLRRRPNLILSLIGFWLRIHGLNFNTLYGDEFNSLAETARVGANLQALPYFALTHLWSALGDSDFWLRFPSVVWGVLAIPVLYLIGRRLRDRSTAFALALLGAINPFAVEHSQQFRFYSFFLFASALALYAFLRFASQPDRRALAFCVAANLLLISSHFFGILLTGLQVAAYLIAANPRQWKTRAAILGAAGALLMGVLFIPGLREAAFDWIQSAGRGLSKATYADLRGISLVNLGKAAQTFFVFTFGDSVYPLDLWLVLPGIFLSAFLYLRGLNALRAQPMALALVLLSVLAVAWMFLFVDAITPAATGLSPRYAVFALPLYLAPIAVGAVPFQRGFLVAFVALLIVQGAGIGAFQKNGWNNNEEMVNWFDLASWVEHNAMGSTVIVSDGRAFGSVQRYVSPKIPVVPEWEFDEAVAQNRFASVDRVIFVSANWRADAARDLNSRLAYLQTQFALSDARVQFPVFAYVFARPAGSSGALNPPIEIFDLAYQDLRLPLVVSYRDKTLRVMSQFTLDANRATRTLPIASSQKIKRVLLLSTVTRASSLRSGDTIAEIILRDSSGAAHSLPLRLGTETQTWDQTCAPSACQIAYTWRKRLALLGSAGYPGALQEFDAHLFIADLLLTEPTNARAIEFRYTARAGSLQIWGVHLDQVP